MPTGYTSALEEMGYDVKRWMKESVVRAFGVCIAFRDDGNMDQKTIMQKLKKRLTAPESHYEKYLQEYKRDLEKASKRTDAEWQALYNKKHKEETTEYETRMFEYTTKKRLHLKAIADMSQIYNEAVKKHGNGSGDDERENLIVNASKFALDQLNQAYEFDYRSEPFRGQTLKFGFADWKADYLHSLEVSVKNYSDRVAEEAARANKQNYYDMYKKYVQFVDGIKWGSVWCREFTAIIGIIDGDIFGRRYERTCMRCQKEDVKYYWLF